MERKKQKHWGLGDERYKLKTENRSVRQKGDGKM